MIKYSASNIASYTHGTAEISKLIFKKLGIAPPIKSKTQLNCAIPASLIELNAQLETCSPIEQAVLKMNFGTFNEEYVVNKYCELTGNTITNRQTALLIPRDGYYITGRIDGITKIADKEYIVEIKTRYSGIPELSRKEMIQMLTYCYLADIDNILYIQCHEGELVMQQFDNFKSDYALMWNSILERLDILTEYVNNINLFRDTLLNDKGEIIKSELMKFLYWV